MCGRQENLIKEKFNISIITSHVIQYQGPLFKELAKHPQIDLTVLFCSRKGAEQYKDKEFQADIQWDRDLLSGYQHEFIRNSIDLWNKIRCGGYDAILIHGYGQIFYWYAWFIAILCDVPVILRGETNLLRLKHDMILRRWLKRVILGAFFSKCSAFLPIGKLNREYYEWFGIHSDKMFFCPYAVDNKYFMGQMKQYEGVRNEIRAASGIPKDKIAILFAGKFLPKKRPHDLIAAYKKMRNREKSVLIFVGDGALKADLVDIAKECGGGNITFLGFLNQTEITRAYLAVDVFVFPSGYEPFGLALNEAMCCRLPVVVSSEVSAGYDLVIDNGFMYPVGNINKLAEILDRLVEDDELRRKMGHKSIKIVSEWNYERDAEGILKALEYVCNRKATVMS